MKVKHIIAFLLFSGTFICKSNAQQLSVVSNTHFNIFNENLAFAGNYQATHFAAEYFKLWNVNGAPESYKFSFHLPLKTKKLGLGVSFNRIAIGAHEEQLAKLAFSYKLPLGTGRLSFGLGAGFSQYNFDREALNPIDPTDVVLSQTALKSTIIDMDFAAIYTDNKTYAGIEINQLTKSDWNLYDNDSSFQIPHFKLALGHVFTLKNNDFVRLSLHSRSDINLNLQTDVLAHYSYQNKIWFGAGFRLGYGLLADLEVNISKRLHAGYSTAIPLLLESNAFNLSHTLFVGYMMPTSIKKAPSLRNF